jgi:tetratricopeptide (TPR) repeat protein
MLASVPATQLFFQGARRVKPDFAPTDEELGQIAQICRLVQGMPLAILLAAAWMTVLTPAEIATEIGRSLDFLETDWHDVPERQRSMRAVYNHSWRLLTGRERQVFARASVFRGGFAREAAERVTSASLRELMALVNKSFLARTPTGRYEVHELLRQYAEEKLDQMSGEKKRALDRHCAYYAEFVDRREDDMAGGRHEQALLEMDNIRAAWRRAARHGKAAEIIQFYSIFMMYAIRGWRQEARATFEQAVDALRMKVPVGKTGVALGWSLYGLGHFLNQPANLERQRQLFRESQSILRQSGARKELATVNNFIAFQLPEAEGRQLLQESLKVFREIGFRTAEAWTLMMMGGFARNYGAYQKAEDYHLQAIQVYERLGQRASIAFTLGGLGGIAREQHAYEKARRIYEESLALAREVHYHEVVGLRLEDLGDVAYAMEEHVQASEYYQEAVAKYQDIGISWRVVSSLDKLADVACTTGAYSQARAYYGQALQLAMERKDAQLGLTVLPGIARLLPHMDQQGRALSTERAVELAALAASHPATAKEAKSRADELLKALQAQLSPRTFVAARDCGENQDLEATVARLLGLLSQ